MLLLTGSRSFSSVVGTYGRAKSFGTNATIAGA